MTNTDILVIELDLIDMDFCHIQVEELAEM